MVKRFGAADQNLNFFGPSTLMSNMKELRNFKPEMMIFWGGSDISSSIYDQAPRYCHYPDQARDILELTMIEWCRKEKIPMLGICRGAQLLCAALGGDIWQDVTNHNHDHEIILLEDTLMPDQFKKDDTVIVTSTHHQMMRPCSEHMTIIAETPKPLSRHFKDDSIHLEKGAVAECEIVSFDDGNSKALMIQGHPEYMQKHERFPKLCNILIQQYLDVPMLEVVPA